MNKLHNIIVNTFVDSVKNKYSNKVNYKSVKAIVRYFSNKRNHSPIALLLYRNLTKKYMDRKFVYGYTIYRKNAYLNIYMYGFVHTIKYMNGRCKGRFENIWIKNEL